MTALILLSHGSRLDTSNQEMVRLAEETAALADSSLGHVRCAFLQFAQPTFEAVVAELAAAGTRQIVVFPLFLSAGSHVRVDVPEMIRTAQIQYPQLEIVVTPHLGGTDNLAAHLLDSVRQAISPAK